LTRPGTFRVIRVDGTETIHEDKPSISETTRLIGCETLDTVTIDRKHQTVMFVDDTGILDGKLVNTKATALYHAVCKPDRCIRSMGMWWLLMMGILIRKAAGRHRIAALLFPLHVHYRHHVKPLHAELHQVRVAECNPAAT
jgi:hypothetical protein